MRASVTPGSDLPEPSNISVVAYSVRRHIGNTDALCSVAMAGAPLPWLHVFLAEYERLHGPLPAPEREPLLADTASEAARTALSSLNLRARAAGQSALCLSGGGVRSASFSIGVLQAMARLGLLRRFDYLSTVSGGGFAGAWLTAWLHRAQSDPLANTQLEQLEGTSSADP